jgi:hypothetical protein
MPLLELLLTSGLELTVSGLISLMPLLVAIGQAARRSDQLLASLRPLSIASIFAGLQAAGATLASSALSRSHVPVDARSLAIAAVESLVPIYATFSCLTLCLAVRGVEDVA